MKTLGLHDEITIIYQVSGEEDLRNLYLANLRHYDRVVCTAEAPTPLEALEALIILAKECESYNLTK